jgi:hypothetical protein
MNAARFLKITIPVLVLILTAVAGAYVLQGRHLLRLMIQALGPAAPATVNQAVTVYRPGSPEDPVHFEARDHYLDAHRFRSDASIGGGRTLMVSGFTALVVLDSKITGSRQAPCDLYKDLLLYRSRSQLEHRLTQLGVDLAISSLGFTGEKTVYVIGACFPDESVPQLWLDKKSLLPVRWILQVDGKKREIQYRQWKQTGNSWYPHRIRYLEDGVPLRDIDVTGIDNTPVFADEFFDMEYLKSIYPPDAPGGRDALEELEAEEIHRGVDHFNEVLE